MGAPAEPQARPEAEGAEPRPPSNVEEVADELLARIEPAPASEARREGVAQFVQQAITRAFLPAFEVRAFTYGSVPLKTYLPDGDIDLAVFLSRASPGAAHLPPLRDTWFLHLSTFLKREVYNPQAPFRIRDVQVIHAEVKLVKCLVDNIVVDISFHSLGGLCTVNFLESIDRHIDARHLFKRSIILVKAWCYYESRLLGAHHGLISTYALETMVLYIFMVHHQTADTPLKVLHRFLTVFSEFDWDELCLSLEGPIPLSSFPNPKPGPLPAAEGAPLLSAEYMADMRRMFSPSADAAAPRAFPRKWLNVVDPLLPSNNLGRSVGRASYLRIRAALAHGAARLTRILAMEPEEGVEAARGFFANVWHAQRSHAARPKPRSLAEAQQQHPAAEQRQPAFQGMPGNWQSMQSVQIPQVLATTLGPLLLQQQQAQQMQQQAQQMQLQQLMLQFGQQHMQQQQQQQQQALYPHAFAAPLPVSTSSRSSSFGRANSLPLAEQQEGRRQQPGSQPPSRPPSSGQLQAAALQQDAAREPQAQPSGPPSSSGGGGSAQRTERGSGGEAAAAAAAAAAGVWSQGAAPQHCFPMAAVPLVGPPASAAFFPPPYSSVLLQPHGLLPGMPLPASAGFHPALASGPPLPLRHSDPGCGPALAVAGDVTLSGDLEALTQHLQSARAMCDRPPPRQQEPAGPRQQPGQQQGRGPTRSVSAGSLTRMRSASLPASAVRRPSRHEANGHAHGSRDAHGEPSQPQLRHRFQGRALPPEDLPPQQQPPSRPASERAASPAVRAERPAPPPAWGPAAAPHEWPEVAGSRPGWSTASEGRPGWVSPVDSSVSEHSLASLKGLRTGAENGQNGHALLEPPPPPMPAAAPPPPPALAKAGAPTPAPAPAPAGSSFVLADEDFPTLPGSAAPRARPKGSPRRPSWLPVDAKKAAAAQQASA